MIEPKTTSVTAGRRLGPLSRQRRRLDRMLSRRRSVLCAGERPLPIDELISPLRYDVVVRERYLRFLAGHIDLYDTDFEAFLARSRNHPYWAWFQAVAIHRIRPGAEKDKVLDVAYRERIHKTARLYRAITDGGFDDRYPIIVRSAGPAVTTDTGKTLAGRLFPSDGCHRLALLRLLGHRQLPPNWYQLQTEAGWRPPDNTHTLIGALGLTSGEYFAFLSLGYANRIFVEPAPLLEQVAATNPDRIDELRRLILVDTPALRS